MGRDLGRSVGHSPLACGRLVACSKAVPSLYFHKEQSEMNDIQYRRFLDLMMCSDPWPVTDTGEGDGHQILVDFADEEARKRGYDSWIDAYHQHRA